MANDDGPDQKQDQERETSEEETESPLRQIVQPFVDLMRAPPALWGINLPYMIEGMCYFGVLGYLAMHFSDFVFQGVAHADVYSHNMVMVLTAGITIAMFFLGFVADKRGVRFALLTAFVLLVAGRSLISAAPTVLGMQPDGLWSSLHLVTMAGILFVVVGYGMYQPAAYAAVRKFTTPKTAGMAFAMLYAVMNLGGWFPSFAFLLRDDDFLGLGIPGTFWVYTGFTVLALIVTFLVLTPKTVDEAVASAEAETAASDEGESNEGDEPEADAPADDGWRTAPVQMWLLMVGLVAAIYFGLEEPLNLTVCAITGLVWLVLALVPTTGRWLARHPLSDVKFFFFIFALIPVQTLFTYNWLVLPQYINRAFEGWIGEYFEVFANANPILIFIAAPIVAAVTQKRNVYNLMIAGTFVMAAPAFLLAIGPFAWTLFSYILIMTIGETMWQPRFLQYAAEIAPEGRTGEYMGVAQLPWFLTKVLVPLIYSGKMLELYCPAEGEQNTELMWLIFACIAMTSTIMLAVARPWVGKGFRTKA